MQNYDEIIFGFTIAIIPTRWKDEKNRICVAAYTNYLFMAHVILYMFEKHQKTTNTSFYGQNRI